MSASTPLLKDVFVPAVPSRRIWQQFLFQIGRAVSSFPALLLILFTGEVFYLCRDRITDPDLWWHLRNAQLLWTHHSFPNIDTFSWTAAGSPWIDHEWLSELFYYAAFHTLGLQGIFFLSALALILLTAAVFLLCFRQAKDPFTAALATFAGGLLATVGFGPRTQHFGWLCFMGIYAIMLTFRTTRRGPLWLIPVLFGVWINCHGGWILGLAIYCIFVFSGLIRRDVGRLAADPWSAVELRKLIVTGIASIAALFVNPFGYRLVTYPFDMLFRQNLNIAHIEEWAAVNLNDARGVVVTIVFGAVLATMLISRKRWRIDDALLTALVLYCGMCHLRCLLLAGIVLPPIITPYFGKLSSYDSMRERRLLNSILAGMVVVACVLGAPSIERLNLQQFDFFPLRAINFLRTHPQSGRMLNVYHWGGYLEWSLPQTKTFIDSRTDIFEYNGTFKDYLDITTLANSATLLDKYKVSYILFPDNGAFPYFLSRDASWKQIYRDGQAVIYRRAAGGLDNH